MKYVEEYLESVDFKPAAVNALKKAYVNPYLVQCIVTIYEEAGFKLKTYENPYPEETKKYGITKDVAYELSKYYKYVRKKEEKEMALYRATHSPISCSGVELMLPKNRGA